jgi:hypothetical protein
MQSICHRAVLSAAVAATGVVGLSASSVRAVVAPAGVAGGDLLILRYGDGTEPVSTPNPAGGNFQYSASVFIDEYTPTGTRVNSFAVPNSGSGALTGGSLTTTEGNLNLSSDGKYVTFAGYRRDSGQQGPGGGMAAADAPRVIGRMALADGSFDTSTVIKTTPDGAADLYSLSSVRGVASTDGAHFWVTGVSSPVAGSGIVYTDGVGASAVSTLVHSQNYRGVTIAGGNLYSSRASSIHKSTGLPTAAQTPATLETKSSGQSYESMTFLDLSPDVPGVDTLYLPNGTNIEKWVLQVGATAWSQVGTIPTNQTTAALNLTAGTPVTDAAGLITVPLYFTTTPGDPSALPSILNAATDVSAFGASATGSSSVIATALTGTGFHGIVMAQTPGDVTGDFKLNADDYARLDRFVAKNGLGAVSASRQDGDLNNDGKVDAADYLMIDTAWAKAHGALDPAILASREAEFGGDYVSALVGAVPEPGSLGLVLAAVSLAGRRRRK